MIVLTALDFDEGLAHGDTLGGSIGSNRLLLSIEAKTRLALLICTHSDVGDGGVFHC